MSVIKETRQVMKKIEVTVGITCDVCGKDIQEDYWTLRTSHNDWGNDSIDSYKHFDLCSKGCISQKLKDYYEDCKDSRTQEFELEQAYFLKPKTTKDGD